MADLAITTQQLGYLLAIDRRDTWAQAAADCGVSASALSQGVAELERRLGVALFERDGRRRVPTPDHAEVLRYAERTMAATHDLARWLDRRHHAVAGRIRVGMIDAAVTHHFRDALLDFRNSRPDVEVRMTVGPSADLLQGLRRAELDLVVCVQPPETPPGVDTAPLLDDPLAVLAPPGRGGKRPSQWGPWVTFPEGSHTRALVEEAVIGRGARFEVVAESNQPEVLREMVLLGMGWTVLSLAGLGPVDTLRVVDDRLVDRRLVLARRSGAPPDPVVGELAGVLSA